MLPNVTMMWQNGQPYMDLRPRHSIPMLAPIEGEPMGTDTYDVYDILAASAYPRPRRFNAKFGDISQRLNLIVASLFMAIGYTLTWYRFAWGIITLSDALMQTIVTSCIPIAVAYFSYLGARRKTDAESKYEKEHELRLSRDREIRTLKKDAAAKSSHRKEERD